MHNLCNALQDTTKSVKSSLLTAGLKEVNFEDLTEMDAAYPHIAVMQTTMARVDHWAHSCISNLIDTDKGGYLPGQRLLGVGGARCKGGRIHSNMPYEVKEVTDSHLTITAQDGSCRTLTLES